MNTHGLLRQHELRVDGEKRKYWLQPPIAILEPGRLYPLVVVLHGSFMSSKRMMQFSELTDLAHHHNCFLCYPDMSYIWQWNVPPGLANKDAIFVERLIDKLIAEEAIDPKRIYATGFSSGADILHLMACTSLSNKIAAFAPVCSNLDREWAAGKEHERPTSILMINGTHDKFNKWDGDTKRWMSVKDSFEYWQTHNRISSARESLMLPPRTERAEGNPTKAHLIQSFDEVTGSEVSLVTIEGGGHTWPADRPEKWFSKLVLGHTHKDKFGTKLIWKFFERHRLKG
ncbi:MAG: hypothetical protein JST01_17140 [Cyanobacteria bacterium SZAS TMP-1]|nr:hypothetical protein [Cyanobacteria bacterium SZAS TMP-1]